MSFIKAEALLPRSLTSRIIAAQATVAVVAIIAAAALVFSFGQRVTKPLIEQTMTVLQTSVELGLKRYLVAGDWFNLGRDLEAVNALAMPTVRFALVAPDGVTVFPASATNPDISRLAAKCRGLRGGCSEDGIFKAQDGSDIGMRFMIRSVDVPNAIDGATPQIVTALSIDAFTRFERQVLWFILCTIAAIVLFMGIATLVVAQLSLVAPMKLLVTRISRKGVVAADLAAPLGANEPMELKMGREAVRSHLGVIEHQALENEEILKQQAILEKDTAVARMTQMLAHDVRKPFSILRMGLGMLGSAKDPVSVKKVLSRLLPEIDKAVSSVDGLIADVMEVGSTSTTLIKEPVSPESLIEATLGEIFRVYPKADAAISYDLQHSHMTSVNVQKVSRVFSNILGNAVQAMGQRGQIWFKTREQGDMIEFCVGNAGSVIPAESLPKLFDAFFTSGKKGGTGLGLAIAQKVVTAHGGQIWCKSSKSPEHPAGQVEFFFTLPTADGRRSQTTATLPRSSSDITKALADTSSSESVDGSIDRGELTLEEDIIATSAKLGRPLRTLVVDDESVYRYALATFLSRTPALAAAIQVVQADDSRKALAAAKAGAFDLVITDVDMGAESLDGFELVAAMRAAGLKALVCVHSNRIVAADHKTALQAGADAFLPKPVARAQLLRLVLQAAEATQLADAKSAEASRQGAVAGPKVKPEVLVIDDNPFVLEAWEDALGNDAQVHMMASLEDLSERLEKDPGLITRLLLAVTDMHLDGSAGDGLDVGRLLKRTRPELRVFLSSDGKIAPNLLTGAVDAAIGKNPVTLDQLQKLLLLP